MALYHTGAQVNAGFLLDGTMLIVGPPGSPGPGDPQLDQRWRSAGALGGIEVYNNLPEQPLPILVNTYGVKDTVLSMGDVDTVVRTVQRGVADTVLSFSDVATPIAIRPVADTVITFSDAVATTRRRALADTVTSFADLVVVLVARGVASTVLSFADTVTPTATRPLADTLLSFSDAVSSTRTRSISDAVVSITDAVATLRQRAVSDTVSSVTDAVSVAQGRAPPADTVISLVDTVATTRTRNLADTVISFADTPDARTVLHNVADTVLSLSDAPRPSTQRGVADAVTSMTDTVATTRLRAIADTAASFSDAVSTSRQRGLTDTLLSLSDTLTVTRVIARSVTDAVIAISDVVGTSRGRGVADTVLSLSDVASRGLLHSVADTALSLVDILATTRQRGVSDTVLSFADTILRIRLRAIADTVLTFSDVTHATLPQRRASDTVLTFADSIGRSVGFAPLVDRILVADPYTADSYTRTAANGFGIADRGAYTRWQPPDAGASVNGAQAQLAASAGSVRQGVGASVADVDITTPVSFSRVSTVAGASARVTARDAGVAVNARLTPTATLSALLEVGGVSIYPASQLTAAYNGEFYWTRLRTVGATIVGKIWLDGLAEPATLAAGQAQSGSGWWTATTTQTPAPGDYGVELDLDSGYTGQMTTTWESFHAADPSADVVGSGFITASGISDTVVSFGDTVFGGRGRGAHLSDLVLSLVDVPTAATVTRGVADRVLVADPYTWDSFTRTVANGLGVADEGEFTTWQAQDGDPSTLSVGGLAAQITRSAGVQSAGVGARIADVDVVAPLRFSRSVASDSATARLEARYLNDEHLISVDVTVDGNGGVTAGLVVEFGSSLLPVMLPFIVGSGSTIEHLLTAAIPDVDGSEQFLARLRIVGSTIVAKVWIAGPGEPVTPPDGVVMTGSRWWAARVTNTDVAGAGDYGFGVALGSAYTGALTVSLDSFRASNPTADTVAATVVHPRGVSDAVLVFGDQVAPRRTAAVVDNVLGLADQVGAAASRGVSDAVLAFSDSVGEARGPQVVDALMTFSDRVTPARPAVLIDAVLSFDDQVATTRNPAIADTVLAFSDSVGPARVPQLADAVLAFGDLITPGRPEVIADVAIAFSDSVATARLPLLLDAVISLEDTVRGTKGYAVFDTVVAFHDTLAANPDWSTPVSDAVLTFSDTVTGGQRLRSIADTLLVFADQVGSGAGRALVDIVVLFDDILAVGRRLTRFILDTVISFADTVDVRRRRNPPISSNPFESRVGDVGPRVGNVGTEGVGSTPELRIGDMGPRARNVGSEGVESEP